MKNNPNQAPIDREISVNPSTTLMCKINVDGIIEYVNFAFSELSGYEEFEIIGESMDILRHPDMPNVIYDVLKERLEKKESIRLINKVLAKDGRYFWLMSDFETKVDDNGEIIAHYSQSITAPSYAVHKISSLYKILSKIESKSDNNEVSKRYLIGFLEERNLSYNQFIEELSINHPEFDKPFQQRPQQDYSQITSLQDENRNFQSKNTNYNSNYDISKLTNNEISDRTNKKPVKKKSLLKKMFGK